MGSSLINFLDKVFGGYFLGGGGGGGWFLMMGGGPLGFP